MHFQSETTVLNAIGFSRRLLSRWYGNTIKTAMSDIWSTYNKKTITCWLKDKVTKTISQYRSCHLNIKFI